METLAQSPSATPLHRMHPVTCQRWVESDEGILRPWGFTVHLSENDCRRFREEFWRRQRTELGEAVPESYVREDGDSFMTGATAEVVTALERLSNRGTAGAWIPDDAHPALGVSQITLPDLPEENENLDVMAARFAVLQQPLVAKACASAAADFQWKMRKVPRNSGIEAKPYFTHPQAVAVMLAECGYDPEVVAAGYLHDHLEDLSELWTPKKLAAAFGARVAALVDYVTHDSKVKNWDRRCELYLAHLKEGPPEAHAISAADKISNIEDSLVLLRAGYPISSLLRKGWKENSEKFHELLDLFDGVVHRRLVERMRTALEEFDRLGAKLEGK